MCAPREVLLDDVVLRRARELVAGHAGALGQLLDRCRPGRDPCGKLGVLDSPPELRGSVPLGFFQGTATKWLAPDNVEEIDGQDYRAVATSGDVFLGGIDWDMRIIDHIAEQFQAEFGSDPREDEQAWQVLLAEAADA